MDKTFGQKPCDRSPSFQLNSGHLDSSEGQLGEVHIWHVCPKLLHVFVTFKDEQKMQQEMFFSVSCPIPQQPNGEVF